MGLFIIAFILDFVSNKTKKNNKKKAAKQSKIRSERIREHYGIKLTQAPSALPPPFRNAFLGFRSTPLQ